MNSMKAPKILPWIAKRAGINEAVALKLWRRAAGEAALIVGNCDSSDFYRFSVLPLFHHFVKKSRQTMIVPYNKKKRIIGKLNVK
jgi:calcineurin-like phosphoesterase family protein